MFEDIHQFWSLIVLDLDLNLMKERGRDVLNIEKKILTSAMPTFEGIFFTKLALGVEVNI